MSDKYYQDTNILVYSFDRAAKAKRTGLPCGSE